jgi:hypothetical protein
MLAIAGGILIALAVIGVTIFGFSLMEESKGCGCTVLAAVALFVLFVIF